jgi:hypothetical protein
VAQQTIGPDDKQTRVPHTMGGTVKAAGPWLDFVSLGVGVLALALGAWYSVDKWRERQRRDWADKWAGLQLGIEKGHPEPGLDPGLPIEPSALSYILTDPSWAKAGEAEEPTGAEEILAASPNPVVERIFSASTNLMARTRDATGGHRWIQLACTAGVVLFLTGLALFLFVPLLLLMVFGYVSDSRHDIRLRAIVGLFLVDIALQTISNI